MIACVFASLLPARADAQDHGRLWGRVETTAGDVHEGFIRWDLNEGGPFDLLDGSKDLEPFDFRDWREVLDREVGARERVIELAGYRISWDDDRPEIPSTASSGIRFGHVRRIRVLEEDRVEVELRSGLREELFGGSTDLGPELRELVVDPGRGEPVSLQWSDIASLELGLAPAGVAPRGNRLHGTVEDEWGRRYTGYLAWDSRRILDTDRLAGEDPDGGEHEIAFADIREIERDRGSARLLLRNGTELLLGRSDDVGFGNDAILISDPGLGMVSVAWRNLTGVRIHAPEAGFGSDFLDGGHALRGTVTTETGDELRGRIRWDGDEEYSWEILDGRERRVGFDVELGNVASIEPSGEDGSRVSLLDGRVLELDGSNDVDRRNHGIFVLREGETTWIWVRWEEVRVVRFDHGTTP